MTSVKALYYPYISPRKRETLTTGLLLYEKIGAIQPRHFFVSAEPHTEVYTTELERLHDECQKYSHDNPLFILDPRDLLKGENEKLFSQAVISDMKNPEFKASAPKGTMTLYADKITRDLFVRFRDDIRPYIKMPARDFQYHEGPYYGTEHFIWEVDEPLAHSILLNLTLLGLNGTDSIPMTDSPESHEAFLTKVVPLSPPENVRFAAEELMRLALPSPENLDIRRILDFRDKHKSDLKRFWNWLREEQLLLGSAFDEEGQLSPVTIAKYENLKDKIESAKDDLGWNIPGIAFDLAIGFSGYPAQAVAVAGVHTALTAMRYASKRYRKMSGIGYLLKVAGLRSPRKLREYPSLIF